jgi:Ca2+/Na+ antiporter
MDYLVLALGLVVLVFAADWFVDGASAIAKNLLPPFKISFNLYKPLKKAHNQV